MIEEEKLHIQNKIVMQTLIDIYKTLGNQGLAFRELDSDQEGNFCEVVNLGSRHNPILRAWLNDRNLRPYKVTYLSQTTQN